VVGFTIGSRGKVLGKTCKKRRNNNNNNNNNKRVIFKGFLVANKPGIIFIL
jgi:hypothetical protein